MKENGDINMGEGAGIETTGAAITTSVGEGLGHSSHQTRLRCLDGTQ